jgi:hypothetical protein
MGTKPTRKGGFKTRLYSHWIWRQLIWEGVVSRSPKPVDLTFPGSFPTFAGKEETEDGEGFMVVGFSI